jgi:hypothetical protein
MTGPRPAQRYSEARYSETRYSETRYSEACYSETSFPVSTQFFPSKYSNCICLMAR